MDMMIDAEEWRTFLGAESTILLDACIDPQLF